MSDLKAEFREKFNLANVTVKELCDYVGYTEQAYHIAVKKNRMVKRTYTLLMSTLQDIIDKKISLDQKNTVQKNETQKILVENETSPDVIYWKRKYEESQNNNKILLNTIEMMMMGKRKPVFQSQTVAA